MRRENEEGVPLGLPDSKEMRFYLALAQVGTEMVAPLLVGLLLDWLFGWLPWATVVGAVLGFVGGMMHMISLLSAHQREEDEERKKSP
jgi:F0F1-type ATP synthase assembly protein I